LVGIFNNNGFVLVQVGAAKLSKDFGKEDFMGAFQFAMTALSITSRIMNGTCMVNVKHFTRIILVSILSLASLLLISLASYMADLHPDQGYWFWVAIGASVLTGLACGLGEATFLGFLKGFPSYTVAYVSSGTGFAGLSGSLTQLGLQTAGFSN